MENIRQYLLTVTASGILCAVLQTILGKKGTYGGLIKLLTGLFMTVTLISPWVKLRISDFIDYWENISWQVDTSVLNGTQKAESYMRECIMEKTKAYILDKANSLGQEIQAQVLLSDEQMPVPCGIVISGNTTPYAKKVLSNYISQELGISEEKQVWP